MSPPQEAVESNAVAPQPPDLQTRQTQSPQPLLIGDKLPPFHQLFCPPLDPFKYLNTLLKMWGPELHTVIKVRPHHCWIQQDNRLFWPAGYIVFDAPQDAVCSLGFQGTLLARTEPDADQYLQIPFCRLLSRHSSPKWYLCLVLLHPRCRIEHLVLINFIPLMQSVDALLCFDALMLCFILMGSTSAT